MPKINQYTEGTPATGVKLLGSSEGGTKETLQYDIDDLNDYFSSKRTTAPASASATGVKGEIRMVSGFAYFCVDTDIWERVAIATW